MPRTLAAAGRPSNGARRAQVDYNSLGLVKAGAESCPLQCGGVVIPVRLHGRARPLQLRAIPLLVRVGAQDACCGAAVLLWPQSRSGTACARRVPRS